MVKKLERGDVFFLTEHSDVSFDVPGKENTNKSARVGTVYERKTNFDKDRFQLKSDIAAKLCGKGVEVDLDLVSRFVEHVTKNRPPERFCIEPGEFIVTFVQTSEDTNNEVVFCRRYQSTDRRYPDHVHFLQNKYGGSLMRQFNILFSVPMVALRAMPLPAASSLKNIEVRIVPPFQLVVRKGYQAL